MVLIKELGVRTVGSSSKSIALYVCPSCGIEVVCTKSNVKINKTGKCRPCADKATGEAKRQKTEATLISDFIKVHGDAYDYSNVVYKGTHAKVEIICKKHGPFMQTPKSHKHGQGCPACGLEKCEEKNMRIRKDAATRFAAECGAVHNYKYDYSLVDYFNSSTKVSIICPIHGVFTQLPGNHKAGQGCYNCGLADNNIALRQATDIGVPITLYYVNLPELGVWKVGCTMFEVTNRFKYDKCVVEVLYTKTYESSSDAYKIEKYILDATAGDRYKGCNVIKGGNTELRNKPVPDIETLVLEAEHALAAVLGFKKDTNDKPQS